MSGWRHVLGRLSGQYAPFELGNADDKALVGLVEFADRAVVFFEHTHQPVYPFVGLGELLPEHRHGVGRVGVGVVVLSVGIVGDSDMGRQMHLGLSVRLSIGVGRCVGSPVIRRDNEPTPTDNHRCEFARAYAPLHCTCGHAKFSCDLLDRQLSGHGVGIVACCRSVRQGRTRGAVWAQERREGDSKGKAHAD